MRRLAFAVSAFFFVLSALFLVGESLDDPGGLAAVGLIAAWAVPLAATMLVAWRRPDVAAWLFPGLITGVIGLSAWFAADPSQARSIENTVGPVRAVVVLALAAALGVYGLRRTRRAGILLLTTAVVPLVVSGAGHRGLSSLAAASAIPLITGTLYLVASFVGPTSAHGRREEREPDPTSTKIEEARPWTTPSSTSGPTQEPSSYAASTSRELIGREQARETTGANV